MKDTRPSTLPNGNLPSDGSSDVTADGTEEAPAIEIPPEEIAAWNEAQRLASEEKWGEALEAYAQLRASIPFSPFAIFERGKIFAEIKQYEMAVESFALLLQGSRPFEVEQVGLSLGPVEIVLELGKARKELGRVRDAMDTFQQGLRLNPLDPELQYQYATVLTELASDLGGPDAAQSYQQAIEALDLSIDQRDDYADAYYERGLAKFATGEIDDAIDDLTKARDLEPENLKYMAQTGLAFAQRAEQTDRTEPEKVDEIRSDYEEAIATFTKFIEQHPDKDGDGEPDDPTAGDELDEELEQYTMESLLGLRAQTRIAFAKHVSEDQSTSLYESAIEDCNLSIEIEPRSAATYSLRGVANRLLDRIQPAIDDFTEALDINPRFANALFRRGVIWFYQGDYQLALGDFEQAAGGVVDGRAQFWLGTTRYRLGEYTEAVERFSEALRQNPRFMPAYNNRGLAYLQLGDFERALDDFNTIIRRDPENARAYYQRSLAHVGLDDTASAEQALERAKQLGWQ